MEVGTLTILGGRGRKGEDEPVRRVELRRGQVAAVVGPTGCGKTTLVNDIELWANRNTPSRREIRFDGVTASEEWDLNPTHHPVALISQHTCFLSDLPVAEFLRTHARVRGAESDSGVVEEALDFANRLTGEPVDPRLAMTELSGGQTRALLVADAVVVGNAPIVLLDELENAGIHRTRALELLRGRPKIFLFVTHDPRIALLADMRIVMAGGAMRSVVEADAEERLVAATISGMDDCLLGLRQRIRDGERLHRGLLGRFGTLGP